MVISKICLTLAAIVTASSVSGEAIFTHHHNPNWHLLPLMQSASKKSRCSRSIPHQPTISAQEQRQSPSRSLRQSPTQPSLEAPLSYQTSRVRVTPTRTIHERAAHTCASSRDKKIWTRTFTLVQHETWIGLDGYTAQRDIFVESTL